MKIRNQKELERYQALRGQQVTVRTRRAIREGAMAKVVVASVTKP